MERQKQIAAADLGHGWTKIIVNKRTWRQPSVVGEARQLFEDNIKEKDIRYKGEKDGIAVDFFVGDLALRHSKILYAATTEEKAKNWTTKVLLETGLALTAPQSNLCLVTGLPIDAYFAQKQQMEELLKGFNTAQPYEVQEGHLKTIARPWIYTSKIVPQPFGSAMNYLLDDKGQLIRPDEARQKILVIDIGYYTLDLLILDGMQIGRESSSPPQLGIDTAYKLIQDYLKEQLGKAPGRYNLDSHVRAGIYDDMDIKPLTAKAFEALAAQIDLEIKQLNTRFNKYIITGGWASMIVDYLTIPKDKTTVMDQFGNAKGYNKIGMRAWREVI